MRRSLELPRDVVGRIKAIVGEIENLIRERAYSLWEQEGRPGKPRYGTS
jgi:Protein of unknown function (DUF2934)